jgi:plasmid stabilization system protein ParE
MHKVSFTKEALFDIEDIVLWYEEQRIGLSYDFELCLEVGVAEISRNPNHFQKRYKNISVRFISRFPFGIHYLIKENGVVVLGIFHTSRSPKNWTKRI